MNYHRANRRRQFVRLVGYLAAAVYVCSLAAGPLRAETFVLQNGGLLEGKLLNPDESPRQRYVVKTKSGGTLTLTTTQVKQVIVKSADRQRYELLLPKMPDTADGNWKMAEWCREHRLVSLREFHLRQVITHEPDHADARRGLGYSQIDGRWIEAKEWMRDQGYVYHNGAWRTAQDVELTTRRDSVELSRKKWAKQLRRWRNQLNGRHALEARENLRDVRDPMATKPFIDLLEKENDAGMRLLYVQVLGRFENGLAIGALIQTALNDNVETVRDVCLLELKEIGGDMAVQSFIGALRSKDNVRVNRAGMALGQLMNSAALMPLIDALQTDHKLVVKGGGGGTIQPFFGGGSGGTGGGGIGVGGGGPKVLRRRVQNSNVLGALLSISKGANFRYDQDAWRRWYEEKYEPPTVDLRRDT